MVRPRSGLEGLERYSPPRRPKGYALLDLNECPFSPPPWVVEAIVGEASRVNRYPGFELYSEVTGLLARYVGVEENMVLVTAGGDEALRAIFDAFVSPGDAVVVTKPGFAMVRYYAGLRGARVYELPLVEEKDHWTIDFNSLVDAARRSRLVVIENPHNPTASLLLTPYMVKELLEEVSDDTVVVIDEAYYEFSGVTVSELTRNYDNLVIVRTLSKAFCLAGLRVGYLIAAPETCKVVSKTLPPFNVSRLSLAAAKAALQNPSYVASIVSYIVSERERMIREINRIDGFKAYMSKTNFILVKSSLEDVDVVDVLRKHNVLVKPVKGLPNGRYARISIGLHRDNNLVLDVLRSLAK